MTSRELIGALSELQEKGQLVGKLGTLPVVVFWHDERPWAIDDRCPHMGFPLHRGTVEDGLVTCHWHHARFDLASGCTLDLFADDARHYDVEVEGDDVWVVAPAGGERVETLERRLREGLEDGLSLVIAKNVLGLLQAGVPAAHVVRLALDFGARFRGGGWGPGMTVVQVVANLLPHLDESEHARALTQGLTFLARDTAGHRPFFPVAPLDGDVDTDRLVGWYRRFVETRSAEAAERALATALRPDRVAADLADVERGMFAACTDHMFLDEGHAIDFTNKAFEAVHALGADVAPTILPTLVAQTAAATRHEETSQWREPVDLAAAAADLIDRWSHLRGAAAGDTFDDVGGLGWSLLSEDPTAVLDALAAARAAGATSEQLARAVAFAAALRLVRFHTRNDVADWDSVHHSFTTANAVHRAVVRAPTPELDRGIVHGAVRVYLDRFLNVPAARVPTDAPADMAQLEACWEGRGHVDRAGGIVDAFLRGGGDAHAVVAELCRSLLREDAGFHWFQVVEAGVQQAAAWPEASDEGRLILVGVTRWLVAHTPTLRQLDQTIVLAGRLRRGDAVYDAD